jgi:membrane protein implicated in regulation of membrane protease activity
MDWIIIVVIIVLLILFWANRMVFWIILSIIGFGLLVLLLNTWFENKKQKVRRLIIHKFHQEQAKRNQEEEQKRQKERQLKEQQEREKRALITSKIDKHLHKALEIMDSTHNWYNDEDEANKELVSVLKAQNIEATYLYRLSNGRTADAKVGNVLIEGKLSPDTAEVDRLIGQISHYVQYSEGNKVNIVIYGKLTEEARERIEGEILQRYVGKVFLSCLENAQRLRKV